MFLTPHYFLLLVNAADSANGGGTWDSTHVIQVNPVTKKTASYKLTSTIMLQITAPTSGSGPQTDLSGSLTRQVLINHRVVSRLAKSHFHIISPIFPLD